MAFADFGTVVIVVWAMFVNFYTKSVLNVTIKNAVKTLTVPTITTHRIF